MMTLLYFAVLGACVAGAFIGSHSTAPKFSATDIENRPNVRALANRSLTHSSLLAIFGVVLALGGAFAYPWFNVWLSRMEGAAELARAENNRQIKIAEANATAEAALALATADVYRAQGVRQANEIIAGQLGGPENYLRFLSIEALKEVQSGASAKIIYVPTEAGLPITEAGRVLER